MFTPKTATHWSAFIVFTLSVIFVYVIDCWPTVNACVMDLKHTCVMGHDTYHSQVYNFMSSLFSGHALVLLYYLAGFSVVEPCAWSSSSNHSFFSKQFKGKLHVGHTTSPYLSLNHLFLISSHVHICSWNFDNIWLSYSVWIRSGPSVKVTG